MFNIKILVSNTVQQTTFGLRVNKISSFSVLYVRSKLLFDANVTFLKVRLA